MRTSLSTRLAQRTRILGLRLKLLPSLKCCLWAEVMNCCTSSGRSLFRLLSQSTWLLRGHATRSWLVFPFVPYCLRSRCAFTLFRGHHSSIILNGMYPRILSRCINWAKSHRSCSVEFDEQGKEVRVFLRTFDRDTFRTVCVATLDRYSSDPHQEVSALGRIINALGSEVWVVSISVRSTILVEAFCEYLGSGYRQKLIDYTSFDLRRFQRCLQWTASSVLGTLDGFAMTVFFVNRPKGTKTRDGMSSRPTLKRAILTNHMGMLHLVDILANIVGVWPLIVPYLKKTGRKDDSDSLVVKSSSFDCFSAFSYPCLLHLWCLEGGNGRTLLPGPNGAPEVSFAASSSWNL